MFHFEIGCVKIDKRCDPSRGQLGNTKYILDGTWQICADICYQTPFCDHWDFSKSTGSGDECRLFRRCTLLSVATFPKFLAGDKNCHSVALSCTDAHKTCSNSNARNLIRKIDTITSWEDCGNHCKEDRFCNFWTYHTIHKCELWKLCPSPTNSPGYLKGHKKCPSISKCPFFNNRQYVYNYIAVNKFK